MVLHEQHIGLMTEFVPALNAMKSLCPGIYHPAVGWTWLLGCAVGGWCKESDSIRLANPCLDIVLDSCPCLRIYYMNEENIDNVCNERQIHNLNDFIKYQFEDDTLCKPVLKSAVYQKTKTESQNMITNIIKNDGNNNKNNLFLYPNPFTTSFNITLTDATLFEIDLLTATGTKIISKKIEGTASVIDLSTFPSGLYIVKVFSEGNVFIKKVIKE